MEVVAGEAAPDQQREQDPEPFDRAAVPGGRARYGAHGGSDHGERGAAAEAEFHIPRHQVKMALSAYLRPQHEHGDQGDQELRHVGESQDGHRRGSSILRYREEANEWPSLKAAPGYPSPSVPDSFSKTSLWGS